MPTLLHITASPRGDYSISRQLTNAAVTAWKNRNPGGQVIERDLTKTNLTFVDLDWIMGAYTPAEKHSESHKKALALSDELIAEVTAADEIVIGTPMYNFAIPAAFKAWIDHVVRAGKTFRYSAAGPEGLLTDKARKVIVVVASGGSYDEGSKLAFLDHEVPYLRLVFGFIGLKDVNFVNAGGTAAVAQGQVSPQEYLAPYIERIAAAV